MQCHIMNVKANCAHVLLAQCTLQRDDKIEKKNQKIIMTDYQEMYFVNIIVFKVF